MKKTRESEMEDLQTKSNNLKILGINIVSGFFREPNGER